MRLPGIALLMAALFGCQAAHAAGFETALHERIEAFVHAQARPGSQVRVPSLADFALPDHLSNVQVSLSTHDREDFAGHTPVTVVLNHHGRELRRGVVTVEVVRVRRVPVTVRPLPAGATIRPDDLRIEAVEADSLPDDVRLDASRIVGLRTTRSLRAGTPLRGSLLGEAPAIARGDRVRLRVEQGALRIDAIGRAREDGRVGERVRVVNLQSRRELIGVVSPDGTVYVAF